MRMKPFYRLFILLLFLVTACKAPRPKYLVKDGGNWDITSMVYHAEGSFNIDTTFTDAGEVHFDMRREEDEDADDYEDWMLEGYMLAPEFSVLDNQPTFLTTTKWFKANTRTGLMLGNNIGYWNFQSEDWVVTDRSPDNMEWSYTSWDETIQVAYSLSRR